MPAMNPFGVKARTNSPTNILSPRVVISITGPFKPELSFLPILKATSPWGPLASATSSAGEALEIWLASTLTV